MSAAPGPRGVLPAEDLTESDVDLGTPIEEYPTLADLLVHTIEVGGALGEADALFRVSTDAGLTEHRTALAKRADILEARAAECVEDLRRRCAEIEAVDGDMTEIQRLREAATPEDAPETDDGSEGGG